jgi:membrane AbrB-like protein
MLAQIRSTLIAAAICTSGAVLFYFLHTPLPWMLGSLSAAAVAAVLGGRWFMPAAMRGAARPVVGVLTGSAFTAATFAGMLEWWDAILVVFGQAIVVTSLGYVFFRRFARFDRESSLFAAAPGGVGEMALLAGSMGADVKGVVVVHLMRILIVLFAVPFIAQLAVGHPIGRMLPNAQHNGLDLMDWGILSLCAIGGYGLGRLIKIPAGLMIFPMLLSAAAHSAGLTAASPPGWLVALVQVVIGGVVGARFAGIRWREMWRTVACGVAWAVIMLSVAAASAWFGSWLIDRSFLAMLLALAPGGTVEMTILTFSVGFEVAFVVTCQISRVLLVLLLTPFLANLLPGKPTTTTGAPAQPGSRVKDDPDLD